MTNAVEKISHGHTLLAILIRAHYRSEGIEFFTPHDFSQQLAYMHRPAGYTIAPHVHNRVQREVLFTQEVLFIKRGRVRVDFYDDDNRYVITRTLVTGDVIMLAAGGHGIEMLEPTEIIEVKQGPYAGDQDKTRFEGISPDKVKITE